MRRRMHRGKYAKGSRRGHTFFEEVGLVDILILFVLIVTALAGFTLAAALAAFGFGIAVIYSIDTASAKLAKSNKRLYYRRNHPVGRFVEEAGVLEAALIVLAIYLLATGSVLFGLIFIGLFGAALAPMVEKCWVRYEEFFTL